MRAVIEAPTTRSESPRRGANARSAKLAFERVQKGRYCRAPRRNDNEPKRRGRSWVSALIVSYVIAAGIVAAALGVASMLLHG